MRTCRELAGVRYCIYKLGVFEARKADMARVDVVHALVDGALSWRGSSFCNLEVDCETISSLDGECAHALTRRVFYRRGVFVMWVLVQLWILIGHGSTCLASSLCVHTGIVGYSEYRLHGLSGAVVGAIAWW